LNIVQIVSDTFRRDFLGCYGNDWMHTEHLDAFAKKSLVFDRAYIASYPTMPNRADNFTGKYTFNYLGWAPLPREEVLLAEVLQREGYTAKAAVDTPFFVRGNYNYDRGFQDFEWIRGQGRFDRADVNLQRRYEADYCAPATMLAASRWLERHYKDKFFLYADTWDPHEPWDPPRWYAEMYSKGLEGSSADTFEEYQKAGKGRGLAETGTVAQYQEIVKRAGRRMKREGRGGRLAADMTEDGLNRLRGLYAGEVTMVDRGVGALLQKIEDLGLLEDTAVIFTTDHGSYHGEHGYVHKRPHFYEEVAHIPLIMWMPDSIGGERGRCDALVQPPDLMPTMLELAGVQVPETVQGKSLLPIIRGEKKQIHEIVVNALLQAFDRLVSPRSARITVTSKDWSLIAARADAPPTDERGEKIEPELYNLTKDPKETHNLFNEEEEVADKLYSKMIKLLKSLGTSEEFLQRWAKKE